MIQKSFCLQQQSLSFLLIERV